MADADVAMPVGLGQIGHHAHLIGGCVPGRGPMRLEADGDDAVIGVLVRRHVGVDPCGKDGIRGAGVLIGGGVPCRQRGRDEGRIDAVAPVLIDAGKGRAPVRKFRLDQMRISSSPVSCTVILTRALYLLSRRPSRL